MLLSSERFIHKFKRAAPLARVVRRTEYTFLAMSDTEALARHAVTCADGQCIGPYGNGFMAEWCKLASPSAAEPAQQPLPSAGEPESQRAAAGVPAICGSKISGSRAI